MEVSRANVGQSADGLGTLGPLKRGGIGGWQRIEIIDRIVAAGERIIEYRVLSQDRKRQNQCRNYKANRFHNSQDPKNYFCCRRNSSSNPLKPASARADGSGARTTV